MGKYIFDHSNGLWYELHGDYFIPCLALEEVTTPLLGIWEKALALSKRASSGFVFRPHAQRKAA